MDTPQGHEQNADQIAYWNGPGGQHWTDRQQAQDTLLAPISELLLDRAKAGPGDRIVDVGCGCGATSIAFAQAAGPTGHVLGIDAGKELDLLEYTVFGIGGNRLLSNRRGAKALERFDRDVLSLHDLDDRVDVLRRHRTQLPPRTHVSDYRLGS